LIEKCESSSLKEREDYWIEKLKAYLPEYGYNLRRTAWAAHDQSGSKNPCSSLNEENVIEIRRVLRLGAYCKDLALQYGVNRATINYIKLGRTWKNVGDSSPIIGHGASRVNGFTFSI